MNISEVVRDRLWMSGSLTSEEWREKGINVVVNLEEANDTVFKPLFTAFGGVYIHAPIHDEALVRDPSLIRTLAQLILAFMSQGRRVLVHCSAGINRSGLVVGRVLIEMGQRPVDAVATVRICRSGVTLSDGSKIFALCNTVFENWLLKEGPRASVMETMVIGPDGKEVPNET